MKFSLYSKKNQLDEMQEQTMRKIESHGFWLLWGSLLAAWIVQTVFGAAVAVTLICGFSYGYWVGAVFAGVFTGILCFALLQLCAALTRKRREHLDDPKDGE